MASNHERKLYKLRIEAKTSLVKRISSFGTDKAAIYRAYALLTKLVRSRWLYIASSFFAFELTKTNSRSIKTHLKKNEANI